MADSRKGPDLSYALNLPPQEAIDYFKGLGYRISRNAVQAYNAAQARAFAITGITRMDVLQDVKAGLDKAMAKGTTFATFKAETEDLLRSRGWIRTGTGAHADPTTGEVVAQLSPHRLKTIFRTNTQSALMAGKYQQLVEDADIAPFWQYVAVMDNRTRPTHAAANGLIFRHDDPFWNSHFPPCGFNCRCSVRALRTRDIDRRGLTVTDSDGMLEPTEVNVGKETRPAVAFVNKFNKTRFVVDPGFGQRPVPREMNLGAVLGTKIEHVAPEIGAAVMTDSARLHVPLSEEYRGWATDVIKSGHPKNEYRVVGVLTPKVVTALQQFEHPVENSAVTLRDVELLHLMRDSKRARGAALTRHQILKLPELLAKPRAVLWDSSDPALVYVLNIEDEKAQKMIVRVNWEGRVSQDGKRGSLRMNSVRTADITGLRNLKDPRYQPIDGKLD